MDYALMGIRVSDLVVSFGPVFLLFLAWLFYSRGRRIREDRLANEAFRQQIDASSLAWGGEVIDAMAEAEFLVEAGVSSSDFPQRREAVMRRLSSLVDRGRLTFPNLSDDGRKVADKNYIFTWWKERDSGDEKERAFTGKRPPIIDTIMYVFYEVRAAGDPNGPSGADASRFIWKCRRLFVTALQAHLDPHRYAELVERHTDQKSDFRDNLLIRAGELGIILDARRGGLVARCEGAEFGWTPRIPPDRRKEILHEVRTSGEPCPPLDGGGNGAALEPAPSAAIPPALREAPQ